MPRAPADSGASAGLALSGLGDASSAVLGPRRGDASVADEGHERFAPPVCTPGVDPNPLGPSAQALGPFGATSTVSARRRDDVRATLARRRRAEWDDPTHDVIAPSHIGEGLATPRGAGPTTAPWAAPKAHI